MALLLPPQSANASMMAGATTAGRYKVDKSQDEEMLQLQFMPSDLRTLSFEQMQSRRGDFSKTQRGKSADRGTKTTMKGRGKQDPNNLQ